MLANPVAITRTEAESVCEEAAEYVELPPGFCAQQVLQCNAMFDGPNEPTSVEFMYCVVGQARVLKYQPDRCSTPDTDCPAQNNTSSDIVICSRNSELGVCDAQSGQCVTRADICPVGARCDPSLGAASNATLLRVAMCDSNNVCRPLNDDCSDGVGSSCYSNGKFIFLFYMLFCLANFENDSSNE